MQIDQNKKILVGLSGGVDSSVTAALLVEQGYDVTGAYMVNFDSKNDDEYGDPDLNLECWRNDYRDAVRVAAHLGIKLLKLDFTKEYRDFVLDHMFKEYASGRTPNPDVMCNKVIKFDAWLDTARELGFDYLATGHYARTDGTKLMQAKDENKDQTYFLHQIGKEQLAHALFPLGEYTKPEVRELAKTFHLPTAEKAESMGVCFVGEVPMTEFLKQKIKPTPGNIIQDETGEIIGQHQGLSFYTIGQRHGFQQSGGGDPLFVVKKDVVNNELRVGHEDNPLLYTSGLKVEQMHWVSGEVPEGPLECEVRLRHRQPLQQCSVDGNTITFQSSQKAVTPGQYAVLYKDDVCLGGGVIT